MTVAHLQIPAAWGHSAGRIIGAEWRRILVLGETDLGKSTYCRFLVNAILGEGRTASFVDADVGQKQIGPPATVAMVNFDAPADFAQVNFHAMYFVGHVNPIAHFLPLVVGTRRMVDAARGEFVVIDTTGLIQGKGRMLKGFQIDSLRPDVVVCLERGDELAPIRHSVRHCSIVRLRPSSQVVIKPPNARRRARERAFCAHLQRAREIELRLEEVTVQRSSLFNGTPVTDRRFLYVEQLPDSVIAVAREEVHHAPEGMQVLPSNFADQLLCGVADGAGECFGIGIISGIDFHRRTLTLYTSAPKRRIRILQFGDLYLDRNGQELHHGRKAHF